MMARKRILYIMGIDWDWIYQRPQVMAEELARDFDVTAVFPRSVLRLLTKRKKQSGQDKPSLKKRILWTVPYQEKNGLIGAAAKIFGRRVFKDIHSFDCIYIGYPLYARYIPGSYKGKVIYDCLDDFEALYPDQRRVERVTGQEQALIKRCDLLLVSSDYLAAKVGRLLDGSKIRLMRNAVRDSLQPLPVSLSKQKKEYKLCYIGTISQWLDYPLLEESLRQVDNISYHLIGPAEKRVENEGIHYEGVVEHTGLKEAVSMYDCLIMPFIVNEIVLAVDPVKLYEYIAFGKCIISVRYPEVERFGEFVYFYQDEEDYVQLLEKLKQEGFPPKYTGEQQKAFLEKNTWSERYAGLKEEIFNILGLEEI